MSKTKIIALSSVILLSLAVLSGNIWEFFQAERDPGGVRIVRPTDTPSVDTSVAASSHQSASVKGESDVPVSLATTPLLDLEWHKPGLDGLARNIAYSNGDFIITADDMLRLAANSVTSESLRFHAIEASDIDTNSVTSRTIADGTIRGRDIDSGTDLTIGGLTVNDQSAIEIDPYDTTTGATGELRFYELSANGTSYVGLKGPDSIASDLIWTLPNADGTSDQALTTDGAGVLSWQTVAGASGAPTGATYLTLSTDSSLSAERVLTGNSQITVTDGGANSPATLSITADSIGDTELAFNTGQHLNTAASPSFTGLTLSGLSTAGIVTNTSGGVLGTTTSVPIANGGTNATTIGSAGSVPYSTGTAYAFSAVGTTGQALISGGTGAPTFYAPTAGSILFAGTSGILQQDNANFFWDNTNNYLGLGYATPAARLDVTGSTTEAVLGAELITNAADRDFSSATGNWAGTNWTIGSGVATASTGNGLFVLTDPSFTPVAGETYQITFTVGSVTQGTIQASIGGVSGYLSISANNTYTEIITAGDSTELTFVPVAFVGTLDNISVKQITPSVAAQIVRNSDASIGTEIRAGGTGLSNTFLGTDAGYLNTGANNAFFGTSAGGINSTGANNAFFGTSAGGINVTGTGNSFFGYSAGGNIMTGSYNVFLGDRTGSTPTVGGSIISSSIGIGYRTSITANNQLVIGSSNADGSITDAYFGQGVTKASSAGITLNATGGSGSNNAGGTLTIAGGKSTGNATGGSIVFSTSDAGASGSTLRSLSSKMTILGTGNVGIGDTTPAALFTVGNTDLFQVNSSGAIAAATGITSSGTITLSGLISCVGIQSNASGVLSCSSDSRLKDIQQPFTAGLDAVMKITPQTYAWKQDSGLYDGGVQYSGFVAQNIAEAIPEASNVGSGGYLQVNTTTILAAAINAIQDQQGEIESQQISLTDIDLKTDQNITTLAELQASVDAQLTLAGTELSALTEKDTEYDANFLTSDTRLTALETLTDQIALDMNARIAEHTLLTTQMATLTEQVQTLTDFFTTFSLGTLIAADTLGNVDLLGGTLTAKILETGTLVIENAEAEAPTIGTATLAKDTKTIIIVTEAVKKDSRIFVTPVSASALESPLTVLKKEAGASFEVGIPQALATDIAFDWWIVEEK